MRLKIFTSVISFILCFSFCSPELFADSSFSESASSSFVDSNVDFTGDVSSEGEMTTSQTLDEEEVQVIPEEESSELNEVFPEDDEANSEAPSMDFNDLND